MSWWAHKPIQSGIRNDRRQRTPRNTIFNRESRTLHNIKNSLIMKDQFLMPDEINSKEEHEEYLKAIGLTYEDRVAKVLQELKEDESYTHIAAIDAIRKIPKTDKPKPQESTNEQYGKKEVKYFHSHAGNYSIVVKKPNEIIATCNGINAEDNAKIITNFFNSRETPAKESNEVKPK